ncbi:MAG: pectate lyase [Bacteroidales bacterium]|nr:pectate lyase [Bacteroidales bacterium]
MKISRLLTSFLLIYSGLKLPVAAQPEPSPTSGEEVKACMLRATRFMMDSISYQGAFVWSYLPDLSRFWGEIEALHRTTVWIQPPGTPSMGQILLDAYHATGDEYYYEQARRVADVLIRVQHPEGGWNYVEDLAGEDSLKVFYATIGRQAWRLEEFQHYYGNITFDDEATSLAAKFLLRLYLDKRDAEVGKAVDRVIRLMLDSQYPNGGWPQRYPLRFDHPFRGKKDYSSFVTLNDDVMIDNIDFLIQCYQALGRTDLLEPIHRAMYLLADLQQPAPLAGWSDQYESKELSPAHARSYEPRSINTGVTMNMIRTMCNYYCLTGDERFLEGVPSAIRFIDSLRLSPEDEERWGRPRRREEDILVPRFLRPEDGVPLYVHRKGSNVGNGRYYTDQDISRTIVHYSSALYVNTHELSDRYEELLSTPKEKLTNLSPLLYPERNSAVPRFYYGPGTLRMNPRYPREADEIIRAQSPSGAWIFPLDRISHPYRPMPDDQPESDDSSFESTNEGDEFDTSTYYPTEPVEGISTHVYIRLMTSLIEYLRFDCGTTSADALDKPMRHHRPRLLRFRHRHDEFQR